MEIAAYIIVIFLLVSAACIGLLALRRRLQNQPRYEQPMSLFHSQRPALEDLFFKTASQSGKPRGLMWVHCKWEEGAEFVKEKTTGKLSALVSVNVAFEAIPGTDMEGLPAVGNLRTGTAVLFFDGKTWQTQGRVIFNLSPADILIHFQSGQERILTDATPAPQENPPARMP